MKYVVNNKSIAYEPSGDKAWGSDDVLLNQADDLTQFTSWKNDGFTIEKLWDASSYPPFFHTTYTLLTSCWESAGLHVPRDFPLDQYHLLAQDQPTHLRAVEKTKLLQVSDFPVPIKHLEERISEICKVSLEAKNPFDHQTVFHFRVIRPLQGDNNPLHRDVWLEDYDHCINLYIPIAGSNEKSSLILIPGSHWWPESRIERTLQGAVINGVRFNVPAVSNIKGTFNMVRPNPKHDEVLVFSPYLIHGGAVNFNENTTRISIEIRLWRKA
jgi:hypothetical protein